MRRFLTITILLTVLLSLSQTADARRRRIRLRKAKAPVEQKIIRKSELKAFAPLIFGADSVVMDAPLLTMGEMGISDGTMIYVCTLPEVKTSGVLTLSDCRDLAQVFIDDEFIGKIDRTKNERTIEIPPVRDGQELKIIVGAVGNTDEGRTAADFVGLAGLVTLVADIDGNELTLNLRRWTILPVRDDYDTAVKALAAAQSIDDVDVSGKGKSGYYRFDVVFSRSGDINLDMGDFGRGQVFVNGNSLGHYSIASSAQTLQVLRRYLKHGFNEVIVFDAVGPASADTSPTLRTQE